jgi:CRP-like cAMP-binding protein
MHSTFCPEGKVMLSLVAHRLSRYVELSDQERRWLADLTQRNIRTGQPRRDIVREGEQPSGIKVILDGWAIRHKMLPDGRRQIIAFMLPGDMVANGSTLLAAIDHSVGAATPITYADVPREELDALCKRSSAIARALRIDAIVVTAIQREWTVNLGQRTARERLAHMMCEIFMRLDAVGLAEGNRCEMPLTQSDLGEASGMTSVHVNRTLQELRHDGLIGLTHRILTIPDFAALADVAMFNPAYLHLDEREASRMMAAI